VLARASARLCVADKESWPIAIYGLDKETKLDKLNKQILMRYRARVSDRIRYSKLHGR
jgi:hypothetical protein